LIKQLITAITCLMLVVLGLLLLLTNQNVFMAIYKSQLALSPNSASFPMWQTLPEPILTSFYLFHVLNPAQVSKGAKPQLEERGPYTFYEQHHKTALVWNKNGTVTYRQIRTWHFAPNLSNGTLDDQVTILNSIAAGLGPMIDLHVAKPFRWTINLFLKGIKEKLFVQKTVGDILFYGYHDPIFDDLDALIKIIPQISKFVPPGSVMDKFAFFYGRNGTDYTDGVWNMFTGVQDVTTMGQVHSWNYSTSGVYPGQCGLVRGSAGEFYPPEENKTYIQLFSNDLCRSLRFTYSHEVEVAGIDSYEYIAGEMMFANGTENPLNSCYEQPGLSLPSGVFNSSLCRFGAPVFISQPHFYQADPYFLSLLDSRSLHPNKEKHRSFVRLEPVAGVPTDVSVRMQVNVLVSPVQGISLLENVSKSFFPVLWSEAVAGVPHSMAFKMKLLANLTLILAGVGWASVGVAVSIVIIATLYHVTKVKENQGPILSQSLMEDSADENVFLSNDEEY